MTRAFLLLLFACGTPAQPVGPTHVEGSASAPVAAAPATVAVEMMKRGGGAVAAGAQVKTGELVELYVTPSQRGYVYVVQFFADGTYDLLFPSAGIAEQVAAARRVRVPQNPKGWLKVTGDAGEEHIHVLFTASPLATISPALAGGLGLRADARAAPPPPPPPDAGVEAPPDAAVVATSPAKVTKTYTTKAGSSGKQTSMLMTYDRGSKALTEIVIDDQPVSLAPSSGITVQTFWYVHAP